MKNTLLAIPYLYNFFQAFVGKFGLTRSYLFSNYLPYCPGIKVLDLGCGPGTCSYLFKPEDYTGIDIDSDYINFAKNKYPDYFFRVADFSSSDLTFLTPCSFDLVFAYGLFHHLDNATAQTFLINAFRLLKPGGRMVCFDGCIFHEQSKLARWVTLSDRGQYIRYPSELETFGQNAGFIPITVVEDSVYSIPYSLMVLMLYKPTS